MVVEDQSLFTPAQLERFDELLANEDREGVLDRTLLVDIVGISSGEMDQIMSEPGWNERIKLAPPTPERPAPQNPVACPPTCG